MKPLAFTAVALIAGLHPVWASNCAPSDNYAQVSQSNLQTLLGGNTACYPSSGAPENQELHSGGPSGTITDYKKGPGDPTDPTTQVGTYSIAGSGVVTYDYGGGATYSYSVWGPSNTSPDQNYDFCSNGSALSVRVKSGGGPC